MATKREKREKNRRKRRFMSDWKAFIPGIALFIIFMFLGEFIDKRVYLTLCIVAGLISAAILILMFKVFKNVGEGFLFSICNVNLCVFMHNMNELIRRL